MPSIQPSLPLPQQPAAPQQQSPGLLQGIQNALQLPMDILARHPEWHGIVGSTGGAPNIPAAPGQSASTGTYPLVPQQNPLPALPPINAGGDPNVAEWQAQQNLLNAQQRSIELQRAANAQNGGVQAQVNNAKEGVFSAQEKDIGASKQYLDEQMRYNELQLANQQKIQAAKANTTDIKNTSLAQRERDTTKYRYELAGLPSPIEVVLPEGYQGKMPLGVVAKIRSLAEIMTEQANDTEKLESFAVEAARIHSANTGLEVTAAQIKAGRVALTLDEAEQAIKAAGYDVQEAQLALSASKLAPSPGLVWDEVSDSWVEPSVARLNQTLENDRIQKEADRIQSAGQGLGAANIETLMTWASSNPPIISDAQLRQGLKEKGVSAMLVENYVKDAQRRRAAATNGGQDPDIQAAIDALKKKAGVGSTTTASQPGIGTLGIDDSFPAQSGDVFSSSASARAD